MIKTMTLGFALAGAGAALAADMVPPTDVFAGAGFKFTLASGASATKQDGPDFTVYYVSWGAGGHLGLYEGCCAQTFLAGADLKKGETQVNGLKARETRREAGAFMSRELYIEIPRPGGEGGFVVHAWYKSLSADDARVADQMIATIAAK